MQEVVNIRNLEKGQLLKKSRELCL